MNYLGLWAILEFFIIWVVIYRFLYQAPIDMRLCNSALIVSVFQFVCGLFFNFIVSFILFILFVKGLSLLIRKMNWHDWLLDPYFRNL